MAGYLNITVMGLVDDTTCNITIAPQQGNMSPMTSTVTKLAGNLYWYHFTVLPAGKYDIDAVVTQEAGPGKDASAAGVKIVDYQVTNLFLNASGEAFRDPMVGGQATVTYLTAEPGATRGEG